MDRLDPLLPGPAVIHERLPEANHRAQFLNVLRRDPGLRKPASLEQLAQVPNVLAIILRTPLGSPECSGVSRLGEVGLDASGLELLDYEAPASGRLQGDGGLPAL